MAGFFLLATPYTSWARRKNGLNMAFQQAAQVRWRLHEAGVATFSPILHSHPVAMVNGIDPLNSAFWVDVEKPIRDACKGMIIVKMEGWAESKGIAAEKAEFEAAGKPVVYMDPFGRVPPELLRD